MRVIALFAKIRNDPFMLLPADLQQMDINDAELEAQLLQAAIVSAPFPHDLQAVKKFPSEVFDYLMMEFQEMAGVTDKKKD